MAIRLKVLDSCPVRLKTGPDETVLLQTGEGYPIYPDPYTGEYEVTPTESEIGLQTNGLTMTSDVTVHGIPTDYVGSAIDRRDSSDLSVSGPAVSVPSGYYEESASATVQNGSAAVPNVNIEKNPTISVSTGGLITVTVSTSETVSPVITEGYIDSGSSGTISFSGTATQQLTVKSSSDMSVSGPTVTAPAGFYADSASKTVSTGNIGVPYIVKDAVTNHSVKLTPYYTKTEGWVSGSGSFSGVQTTVTAADLVSGTLSITANTTYDVTNYAEVDVAVPIPELQTINTSYTASTVQQTDTIVPTGAYEGIEEVNLTIEPYTLESVSHTFTPTTTAQTQSFTASTADALSQVDITVSAVTSGYIGNPNVVRSKDASYFYETISYPNFHEGYITSAPSLQTHFALEDKTVTPSTTAQTVTPTGDSYYLNSVTVSAVTSGSAGTPTATKGTVTNHSVTVTPSVTNTTGYINGGTITGTAVTVSASELVSGTLSITANTTGQDVTNYQKVDVSVSGGITPTGNINITSAGTTDVTNYATATVPSALQFASTNWQFVTENNAREWKMTSLTIVDPEEGCRAGWIDEGVYTGVTQTFYAVPSGTTITPTESSQTIGGANYMMEGAVTVNAIPSNYVGSAITSRTSSDLSASGATVTAPAGFYSSSASTSVQAGSATASASKGTVTNHSITVTPMVTRTAGYVTAGTANGTAVTVSASELVSGSETKTSNGTYDVTNLASLVVNVSGGGGSGIGDLLSTTAIGAYSTAVTSATNMNKSIAATNINAYDVLLVETSVDTEVANRHTATVGVAFITNSTNAATKNAAVMANAKWNAKLSSSSVTQTTSSTTAYGIYPNSCTVTTTSNGTATFAMYSRYNSSRSGTINGTYTARVYGIKLCDLIGG